MLSVCVLSCSSEGPVPPAATVDIVVQLTRLESVDTSADGTLHAWVIDLDGTIRSAGPIPTAGETSVRVASPDPEFIMVTLEPPGDSDDRPSAHKLVGGRFNDGFAVLAVDRYVTAGMSLEEDPGRHILATLSDNLGSGQNDNEDAGIWLFDPSVDTLDAKYYQDFAPLTEGWAYEGWVVRDYGAPGAVWVSYGKFLPDGFRQANSRDDTGVGYFSGVTAFERAFPLFVRFPGDDFLSDSLGYVLPAGISLPLDLNGDLSSGVASRWTHVITIEPWGHNRDAERPEESRPFVLEPYRNAIGEADPAVPRLIEFHPEHLPGGTATIVAR